MDIDIRHSNYTTTTRPLNTRKYVPGIIAVILTAPSQLEMTYLRYQNARFTFTGP